MEELSYVGNGRVKVKSTKYGDLTLVNPKFDPLNVSALESFRDGKPLTLTLYEAAVEGESPIDLLTMDVTIPNLLKTYCGVSGGWLPPPLGMINSSAFADRNFLTTLKRYFENNRPKPEYKELEPWLPDLSMLDLNIDVLPYAFEGNSRRFPTREEVCQQIEEAKSILKRAAPGIGVLQHTIPAEQRAWQFVQHFKPITTRRMAFLSASAKYLKPSRDVRKVVDRWNKIVAEAKNANVAAADITILLALLCVAVPQDDPVLVRLLKVSDAYDQEKAYGACTDIALLEMLLQHQHLDPSRRYSVISGDTPLIKLFGFLRQPTQVASNGVSARIDAKLIQLMDRADPELRRLLPITLKAMG